jgi:hypothetical protein
MIYKLILKSIPSLLFSIIFLAIFYWQFIYVYGSIIDNFEDSKLSTLYIYIFLYTYGVLILSVTLINIFYKYLIKNRIFIIVTLISILIFYILSFKDIYHTIEFFLRFSPYSNSKFLTIFFLVLSFGYAIYSLILGFLGKKITLLEILSILFIGAIFSFYIGNFI